MSDKFTLAHDAARNRIDFTMTGQWTPADAQRWTRDYTAAIDGAQPGFVVIGDMTDLPLQTAEIQATHEQLMGLSIQKGMAKAALIVPAATLKLQLKRLAATSDVTHTQIVFVGTKADAEATVDKAGAAH